MSKLFSIQNLSYAINSKTIIKNSTCNLEEGITLINGCNGAGKTTFLKLLFGILHPTSGSIIRHFDMDNTEVSFVFQKPIFLNRTVENNLKHILHCKSVKRKDWNEIIDRIVNEYSLENIYKTQIRDLSGGELQLLSLIRSMIMNPKILIFDEPTNNLDDHNNELVTKMIKNIHSKGLSLIIVSHTGVFDSSINYNQILIKDGLINNE